ncbi:ubiquitin carboxyl-terminal hydrolase 28 isoform X5 [Sylvia atricapilla]|uniref:ubiquitin carboxyl-terminal hydrolase 28 isoform X5 n=1 Tax=Sylvia atricapilla TaxID=48155 RepID=UPI00339B67BE
MTAELRARGGGGEDCQVLLNQMKEITGIQDSAFLLAALKAADGDLMEAVTFLTEDPAPEPVQKAAAAEPSAWEESAVGKQLEQDVSSAPAPHNQDNLCPANTVRPLDSPKALAAERDAAERPQDTHSAENKNRSKRKRCEVWGENPKQNDWRRAGDWPVGMKNIGNTCWFSAVIQSLFQLPEFRRLVLGYSLPQNVLESCRSHTGKRNIAFMQELQCLFALMLGTWRKFVDPSAALELLRDVFRSAEQPQQDVSEFTHKLLDWLEDAFQLTVNVTTPGDKSENPMVQLFYGTFLTEGVHEGNTFSKIETFGQYPLQVNGYRNLNECLEGAMVEGEMDEATASQSVNYGQERWFTKLPPVLTFELSRFEFNQSLGQPEKIHTKLEFPQTIYMDRYLYCNKDLVQMKREEMKRLKEKMVTLQQKLESIQERTDTRTEDEAFFVANSSLQQNSSMALQPAVSPAELSERPAPHVVSEEELNLVQTCLQRWRNEIEQDVQDLKESIARINLSIKQMYCDPLLQQVPYRLHAVLVHEGQANAGHYWAFIYDQPRQRWLKYNDILVTESSWEELERESFGGLRNASAYCLMYISDQVSRAGADEDEGPEARQFQKEVEALSPELKHYIQEDNWRLEQEAEEWDEEQSCKIPQMEPSPTSELQDLSSESGPEQSSVCEQSVRSLSSEHARIAKEQTAKAIANTADAYEKNGVEAALCEAFHEEYSRLYLLSKETPTPQNDARLQHVLIYFLQNNAPQQVVERTLLEQFADKNLSYDERSISIMKVARAKLSEIGPDDVDMEEYKRWHEDYSLFRKVSIYLLTGLELYQNRKYQESLTYLVYAYQSNTKLLLKGTNRGVSESLIALYRRKCLLKLNEVAASLFVSCEEAHVSEGVSILNELIIPCMHLMNNFEISKEDLDAIEVMRNRWCSYLGREDMDAKLQMKLGELLPRLLDGSTEVIVLKEPPKIRPNSPYDLCSRFAAVMESIHGASTVTVK